MSAIDRGPEHQCGGPQEGCCIPGCPECRMPVAATVDNLDAESAAFVAHRCWTYEALLDRIAELESRRPVVCETCHGSGTGSVQHADFGWMPHGPCPDCGKDGCGPGVRWA